MEAPENPGPAPTQATEAAATAATAAPAAPATPAAPAEAMETEPAPATDPQPELQPGQEPQQGVERKKVAMFCGYIGAGYYGFQRLKDHPSIEVDLEAAVHRAGGISDNMAGTFTRVHWSRAARTDRGVSAAANVVSLQLLMQPNIVDRINAELPPQIRVWGVTRTTPGFDARKMCDRRRYEYLLPMWALDPAVGQPRSVRQQQAAAAAAAAAAPAPSTASSGSGDTDGLVLPPPPPLPPSGNGSSSGAADAAAGPSATAAGAEAGATAAGATATAAGTGGGEVPATAAAGTAGQPAGVRFGGKWVPLDAATKAVERSKTEVSGSTFLLPESERRRLNLILGAFEGTHNFHNFTTEVGADSFQAFRTMRQVYCEGPVWVGGEAGAEGAKPFLRFVFHGNSFMLHQIRKMVGLAVAVARGAAPPDCVRASLDPNRDFNVPTAPATGLFMDEAYYDEYNGRFGADHPKLGMEPFRDASSAFKTSHIYPHIAATAPTEMWLFLASLNDSAFGFSLWKQAPPVRRVRDLMSIAPWQKRKDSSGGWRGGSWGKSRARGGGAGRGGGGSAAMIVAGQETYGTARHTQHTEKWARSQGETWTEGADDAGDDDIAE